MKINCYTNIPSHYQAAFYRKLREICEVQTIFSTYVTPDRLKLGWQSDLTGYNYSFDSKLSLSKKIFLNENEFHFLAGLPGGPLNFIRAMLFRSRLHLATQTEMPPADEIKKTWTVLSYLYSRLINHKKIAILGIGQAARNYFSQIGIKNNLVFPFAYFPESLRSSRPDYKSPIIYIGQLITRKGVDVLLKAIASSKVCKERGVLIVGDGEKRIELEQLAFSLKINTYVNFIGAVNIESVGKLIEKSSCLILPSRHDGWGVTINEALIRGVPVVVSEMCGSAELIKPSKAGYIFQNESIPDLVNGINSIFSSSDSWQRKSDNAYTYSPRISPEQAAKYFYEIVAYVNNNFTGIRPVAPWLIHFNND